MDPLDKNTNNVKGLSRQSKSGQELDFKDAYGENIDDALNMDTWTLGGDLLETYSRLEQEVAEAVEAEDRYRQNVRDVIFSRLGTAPGAPKNAGVYEARPKDIKRVHTGILFNGGVEACDGTSVVHDTLPLTITQLGICLVSYNGELGSWTHRLYRKDLRERSDDPIEEVLAVLEKRERREAQGIGADSLSELARRGIMAYAERAILRSKSNAPWRMGHGSPVPYELITGLWSSSFERIRIPLELIEWYVLEHKKFVFVPSAPRKRHWLTLGNALNPMEFAIVRTLQPDVEAMINRGGYREAGALPAMRRFCAEVAPKIITGVYRVWEGAPPYLFYAHIDHAEMAAHIAMADSVLQEYRGFPMLIDLADTVCSSTFGADSFISSVQMAYAAAGQPTRYLGERETRNK